tara:strand:+ start:1472 stop:1996 length:525 start_codon:yes stop_codon:yes gene_type:complete
MRNLILIITALISTSVFAQYELARLQIIFRETEWSDAYRDTIEWEVWAEPSDKFECSEYRATKEKKSEYLNNDYIAAEIEKNRSITDQYSDEFVLWFPVYRRGIYHVGVRNKYTGELMGNTVTLVGRHTNSDFGWVAYDHDFILIQLRIDDEKTQTWGGGCQIGIDHPISYNPN